MVDEQALVDGLKPGHLAAAGLASFGSQAGSHEHVGMRLAADIVTAKVLLEGWVRTSTGRPGRHGMQEVREFDSPRLHQKGLLRSLVRSWGRVDRRLGGHFFLEDGRGLQRTVGGSKSNVPRALSGNSALVG